MKNSQFFIVHGGSSPARKLYAFTYAGGSAASFSSWPSALPISFQLCAAEYPGRGIRFSEPNSTSIQKMARDFVDEMAKSIVPNALFGHSLGALVAFEVARELQNRKLPAPLHLFVSGCNSPHLERQNQTNLHQLADQQLKDALLEYNGTPAHLFNNHEMMSIFLPIIRKDISIAENYEFIEAQPLTTPITICVAKNDPYIDKKNIDQWSLHTRASLKVEWFDGDHFYIHSELKKLTRLIALTLGR